MKAQRTGLCSVARYFHSLSIVYLSDAIFDFYVEEVVLAGEGRPGILSGRRGRGGARASCDGIGCCVGGRGLLERQYRSERGVDRLSSEGQRIRALLYGVEDGEDLRVAVHLELLHAESEDFGDGLFPFGFVQFLRHFLFENEDGHLL